MVISSFGVGVLPCMLFYLLPLRFSRPAHRLATGRKFFPGWQTSLEFARIHSYRLALPSQSTQTIGKTVVRTAVPVKFAILVFFFTPISESLLAPRDPRVRRVPVDERRHPDRQPVDSGRPRGGGRQGA